MIVVKRPKVAYRRIPSARSLRSVFQLAARRKSMMKSARVFHLAFFLCMILTNSIAVGQNIAGVKRYQIKSGIVEYTLSGTRTGTETIYFDNWGMREAKYTKSEMSMMGVTQKQNTLVIIDGETTYSIDLDTKTGTKMETPMLKELAANNKDLTDAGEKMMKSMGGAKIGTEVVLGKTCDVWEIKTMQSKTWVWKNVPLKTQVNMANMQMTMIATKFEEGASIPADKFKVSSDVTITEGVDMKKMLEGLKSKKKN